MRKLLPVIVVITVVSSLALARKDRPGGDEIRNKAKSAKLDSSKSITAKGKGGKTLKFTAAVISGKQKHADMENGHLIGVMDSQLPLTAKRLPAGTYNVFSAKVGTKWTAYFEQNGKVVGMTRLEVTKQPSKKDPGFKKKKAPKGKAKGKKSSQFGDDPTAADAYPVDDDEVAYIDADCWEEDDGWWCEEIDDVVCYDDGYCEDWSDE